MKRLKLRRFPRLGRPRLRGGGRWLAKATGRIARFLFRSHFVTIFFGLCVLGILVGTQTRPAPGTFPDAELFDQLQVMSYRDAPSDTSSRFVVQLCAGGRIFSQYDVESRTFQPPPSGRSYARTITGSTYAPLRVRGHVGYGFWLDVPRRRAFLPEQYDELYQRTLAFVKPLSDVTQALGVVSGYSVGYRLGTWNSSLSSRKVQERVLATPDLGRMVVREAWRRVLLEPVVMTGEEDAERFAEIAGTHQLYTNFFRLALNDSDSFIPREAARLEGLGHGAEARAMLAFAASARHAAQDTAQLTNADFESVERWAALLDRRGHWVNGAIPPPGEERIKLMGTLAWYGLAPLGQNVDRVWVGPRMLVRVGDTEGFVADEIPATGTGCPISWQPRLGEDNDNTRAMVGAWLADRPEFVALAVFGQRLAQRLGSAGERLASGTRRPNAPAGMPREESPMVDAALVHRAPAIVTETTARRSRTFEFHLPSAGNGTTLRLVAADSAQASGWARAAQAVTDRNGSRGTDESALDIVQSTKDVVLSGADEVGDTLRARGVRDAMVELRGTTLAIGASAEGQPWSAALRDPRGRLPVIARLRLVGGEALATAVARESSQGLIAVAVVASDARTAERWAGSLLTLDPAEAREKARQTAGLGALLIEPGADGRDVLWIEAGLRDRLVLDDPARGLFRIESF